MMIDTHCHLDASEFAGQGDQIALNARQVGVGKIVIPAVCRDNFDAVRQLGRHGGYALGIHPLYVPNAKESDLELLESQLTQLISDPFLVAVGEIGLDYFVPELCTPDMREKQFHFYTEQLRMARRFDLPVLLHTRRSVDMILKGLRRISVRGGIAHAFKGSEQQAQHLINMDFKLGFGGAMTYTRALQIRRLASELPMTSVVLETDAPDISPSWIATQTNTPDQLPRIAQTLADLRNLSLSDVVNSTTVNTYAVLPRLQVTQCEPPSLDSR